jgi:hypothetical protein
MSVRTRAATLAPGSTLAAAQAPLSVPQAMHQAAADVSQMTMDHSFAPGEPVGPYSGYDRYPRGFDFTTGYNIATRPRTHERVSFDTLRGLIEAYDIASICIWHTIDTLRGVKWKLLAADGYSGDVTGAIRLGTQVMRRPDRKHNFRTWFAKWFYDVLAYDAAPLFRLRNRAGKCIGLLPFDGTTLAPLLDYWGNSPEDGAEAYVQYANGLPWNWLTRADVIYEPFRAVNNSPYGKAPIESIILNANTDIRFQLHFLMRFTEGNIPEAFASSPETWSPDQIEQFQGYWDSFMYGDQSRKHQIRWMPGGSTISWTNEKDFSDAFSLFMMRKTCSAFHKVPTDLGFTDNANYSTGESQADVAHKVGELPPMEYAEEIISRFLYDDIGIPVKFEFDRGEDQDDRLNQANADQVYIQNAVVSASEIREMRFGLAEPEGQAVPRIFYTTRSGPIPLNALYGVAGKIDPETAAPAPDAQLPHEAFLEVQGAIPNPALMSEPLAEQEYGAQAIPPAPPMQPQGVPAATTPSTAHAVAKEDGGSPGVTSDTGIYSYDLAGRDDDEDEDGPQDEAARTAAVKSEMAAFRRFAKSRQRAGRWRDFEFAAVDSATARRLNAEGHQAVAKSGYSLSPRSGMISLDVPDGLISPLPGGVDDFHVTVVYLGPEVDDDALVQALMAARDAAASVPGPLDGMLSGISSLPPSDSSDGKVPAFVPVMLPGAQPLRDALEHLSASEHPDWTPHVTVAYLNPGEALPGPLPPTPVTFTHLSVHRGGEVTRFPLGGAADAEPSEGGESTCPCGTPVVCGEMNGWQHADGSVSHDDGESVSDKMAAIAKAENRPKAWPGWKLNGPAVAWWAPKLTAAVTAALPHSRLDGLASAYLAANPEPPAEGQKRQANEAAQAWLASQGVTVGAGGLASGIVTDGYLIGAVSADSLVTGTKADTGGWRPGDTRAATERLGALGVTVPVPALDAAAGQAEDGYQAAMGRSLADSQQAGLTAKAAGAALAAVLADAGLAAGIVLTQVTTASAEAARDVYAANGVDQVDILNGPDPCPACEALADSNPHSPGLIPLHPNCVCAEAVHRA